MNRIVLVIVLMTATFLVAETKLAMAGVIVPISATTDMGSTLSNLNNTINGNGLNGKCSRLWACGILIFAA